MVMQHRDITMTHFESYVKCILYLGRRLSLNFLCPLALFTVTNSPFGATFVPNSMTNMKKYVSTITMVPNVDQVLAPTNMRANLVEIQAIQGSNVQKTKTVAPNTPNLVPTSVNAQNLAHELQGYDLDLISYLVSGFQLGFKLGCVGEPYHRVHKNHNSVYQNPGVVHEKISNKLALGRISEPHMQVPFKHYVCSPLGLVPKKVPGEFRMIYLFRNTSRLTLSFPNLILRWNMSPLNMLSS